MPQPALHLLLARETLARWRSESAAPFDIDSDAAVNAFLHGSLAPDMGSFPGGSRALSRAVHTRRTGALQRGLIQVGRTEEERAFAWGWLTHVLADVLIHPLVNEDAAQHAGGAATTVEHVRVEVGLDAWFCWQHPTLDGLRLRPAFDRAGYRFLADALNDVLGVGITTSQLVQMERGLMLFSHAALHFATSIARQLCWQDAVADHIPLGSAMLWHTASRLSPRNSVVNAYLTPHAPGPELVADVVNAIRRHPTLLAAAIADRAESLPNYNLEDGTIVTDNDRRVA